MYFIIILTDRQLLKFKIHKNKIWRRNCVAELRLVALTKYPVINVEHRVVNMEHLVANMKDLTFDKQYQKLVRVDQISIYEELVVDMEYLIK